MLEKHRDPFPSHWRNFSRTLSLFFLQLSFSTTFLPFLRRCLHRKKRSFIWKCNSGWSVERKKIRNLLQINGRHLSIWHMRWHCLCLENGQKNYFLRTNGESGGRSNNNKINVIRQSSLLMWNNQIECRAFDDARFSMLRPNSVELQPIFAEIEIYSPHANYERFFVSML